MCPVGGGLFDGFSTGLTARLACHCLLIEADHGLILVDTGFGLRDMRRPLERMSPLWLYLDNIQLDERLTAVRQIEAMGFDPRDVRHIVMTHLDFDHAGGLEDFPWAAVHVTQAELDCARSPRGPINRRRYADRQFDEVRHWTPYRSGGETWHGFRAVRDLHGLPPEILMVALPGHTLGHVGVAIKDGAGWIIHAADAYFDRHEMDHPERSCPPGKRAYQRMMAMDIDLHRHNQGRLRELYRDGRGGVSVFCTHDAVEFEALQRLERFPDRAGLRPPPPSVGSISSAL